MATRLLLRALWILTVGLGTLRLCACQPSVGLTDSGLSNWNDGILSECALVACLLACHPAKC
jgi:hypothetical protein